MHMLAFFTPKLQLCDFGFYGAVLELASKKVLRRAAGKRAAAKEGPEYGRKKKMDVTGMLPAERPYRGKISIKQRTYPQKTSGEEKSGSWFPFLKNFPRKWKRAAKWTAPRNGSLLVANIAVVCSLFFFCNFPGGNGFRVFQQEHLLADRSSGGVHFNGMYACKKSSK